MSSLAGSKTLDGLRDAFVRANPKQTLDSRAALHSH